MSDLFRPISQMGLYAGLSAGRATVFIVDMDVRNHIRQLQGPRRSWRTAIYLRCYERVLRFAAARASVSFLKGASLCQCAGPRARNVHDFVHTAHLRDWVISPEELQKKSVEMRAASTLRMVFIGRLTKWKGLIGSIRTVDILRRAGVPAELDIFGGGEQLEELNRLAHDLNLRDAIRFLGARPYSSKFVTSLRDYHLMLYTPEAEDTPRSIFDAMAAGVPTASFDFEYTRRWVANEYCGIVAPWSNHEALARQIAELWNDRPRLIDMAHRCAAAGAFHSAEAWFNRRARLTFEAVDAHRTARHVRRTTTATRTAP
ncbi:MAG: glycosyltransferase [Phycisphaerae bacterium]|nr:glycosyltransferase [Phycisphaerae bacterium]